MRSAGVLLLLIALGSSVIFYSLLMKIQASDGSGTGIGIRKEGPLRAKTGETIEYTIFVYNLGDFWIRNVTVTDIFPNGTSSFWVVPDLAPLNQTGNSFTISKILYTIRDIDVLDGPPSHIQNHAEVRGYLDFDGLNKLVYAITDYPTLVIKPIPVVGGYSVAYIKTTDPSTPYTVYIILLFVMSAIFTRVRSQVKHMSKNHRVFS